MKLSFDNEESFKEAIGSLRFINPPSDPEPIQQIGSMPHDCERSGDICFNNPPSDPNIPRQVRSSSFIEL